VVVTIYSDIFHIRESLVSSLLLDLQVSDLDATDSEGRDVEFDTDRFLQMFLAIVVSNGRDEELQSKVDFSLSREVLNVPDNAVLIRKVADNSVSSLKV
jgi:hypothetical protein